MAVIAVVNHKGGVGKTTTVVNLGAALQEMGKRVLLVDLDPEAGLTIHLGIRHPETLPTNCGHVLKAAVEGGSAPTLRDVLTRSPAGLDLIPAGWQLDDAEAALGDGPDWAYVLRGHLDPLRAEYDYVLIDCLPGRSFLGFNAVAAADAILVPLQTDYLAIQGLALTFQTAVTVQRQLNPRLGVLGILMTMVNLRTRHSREEVAAVRQSFEGKVRVFETVVPCQVGFKESARAGTSVLSYEPRSVRAATYRNLAVEVAAAVEEMGLGGASEGQPAGDERSSLLAEAALTALAQADELAWAADADGGVRVAEESRGGYYRVRRPAPARAEPVPEPAMGAPIDPAPSAPAEEDREDAPSPAPVGEVAGGGEAPPAANGGVRQPTPARTPAAAPYGCPFLGLADDRAMRLAELSYAHRCWAGQAPLVVDIPTQQTVCLRARHQSCPRYLRRPTDPGQSAHSLFTRLTTRLRTSR